MIDSSWMNIIGMLTIVSQICFRGYFKLVFYKYPQYQSFHDQC